MPAAREEIVVVIPVTDQLRIAITSQGYDLRVSLESRPSGDSSWTRTSKTIAIPPHGRQAVRDAFDCAIARDAEAPSR